MSPIPYMLLNKKGVAKVSKTPGKTKLINYFLVNDNLYFVDLPGYGYAKLSKKNKIEISKINQTFFKNRNQLKQIFLLIDIRHKLQIIDLEFMSFLKSIDRDFTIIFTKKDKIKDTVVANYCKNFLKSIENIYEKEEYFVSSSKTRYGREDILEYISKVSH